MRSRTASCPVVSLRGFAFLTLAFGFLASGAITMPFSACGYDFIDEVRVSSGVGTASEPILALDSVDNVFVSFIESDEVAVSVGPLFDGLGNPLTDGDTVKTHPSIHIPGPGQFTVVFEEVGEIIYIKSFAGTFADPTLLSLSADDAQYPDLARGVGIPENNVVWVVEDPSGVSFVHVSRDLGRPTELVEGEQPAIASDAAGIIHVVYVRDGDLFYNRDDGIGFGAEQELTTGAEIDSDPALDLDADGTPIVVFVRDSQAAVVRGDGAGSFLEPFILSIAGHVVSNPQLAVGADSSLVMYQAAGDLWLSTLIDDEFTTPEIISNTTSAEDQAGLRVDSIGLIHIVYHRDGEIYYRNDASPPVPDFTASVLEGDAPLTVQFTFAGSGLVTHYAWDFGDGDTAIGESIEHTYHFAGTYDVTLTASGPGGSYSINYSNLIEVSPPSNVMSIPDITVFQGEPGVVIPVIGKHANPAQGYQIAASWDDTVLMLDELTLDSTDTISYTPEFFAPTIVYAGAYSYFYLGLVLDFTNPFDGRTLPAGDDQRLLNLEFTVNFQASAPAVSTIELRNDLGDPVIQNVYTVDGLSKLAALHSGDVTILPFVFPPPQLFLRGDHTGDGQVALVDAIGVLSYLFQNGAEPPCADASDVDDNGSVALVDAILILNFLFTDIPGSIPAYPYPGAGLDPTPDNLGDC